MKFIVLSLFLLGFTYVQAQSLSSQMGAIQTDFKITSGSKPLKIKQQYLIKTGKYYSKYDNTENKSYGYAAGYESFNLEFSTAIDFSTETNKYEQDNYRVNFFDSDNELITTMVLNSVRVKRVVNTENIDGLYYYTFDLVDVPIIVLDNAKTIDIILYTRR